MALTHIRRGDVVFTVDGTGTAMHRIISMAQTVGSSPGNSDSVHAAIATGQGTEVCESVGSGLTRRALKPGNYRIYAYRGPMQSEVRDVAALIAESFCDEARVNPNPGGYQTRKAALSPFRSSSSGHQTTNQHTRKFGQGAKAYRKFFCSNRFSGALPVRQRRAIWRSLPLQVPIRKSVPAILRDF